MSLKFNQNIFMQKLTKNLTHQFKQLSKLGKLFCLLYAILVALCLSYSAYAHLTNNWNNWSAFLIEMIPVVLITLLPFGLDKALLSAMPLPIVYILVVCVTFALLYYAGKALEVVFKKAI
jgi:hypothetical protein